MAMFDESNIMSDVDVESLFGDGGGIEETTEERTPEQRQQEETTEEITDPNSLFVEENPESVGSDSNNKEQKEPPSTKGTSPTVLSSLAKALKEEGILLDLADEDIDGIKDHEGFKAAIEKQLKAQFDERQRRVDEALGNGVEPDVIRRFENTLAQLNRITNEQLKGEDAQAEQLRRYILKQDYLNRNYSAEQAERMVNRSVSGGTDIEDAIDALANIKTNVQNQYDNALEEARKREEDNVNYRKQEASNLRKGIMEGKDFFGELQLTQAVKQKVLDNIIKPIWKDPETGETYTAIQKYEKENRVDFLQKVGIIFTLTDGFKNLDGLIKGKVTTEMKKGLKELEHTLNNTQRNSDGTLNFASGVGDSNSFLSGFTLDL